MGDSSMYSTVFFVINVIRQQEVGSFELKAKSLRDVGKTPAELFRGLLKESKASEFNRLL